MERMHHEHQGELRKPGRSQRSCEKRQNKSDSTQREELERTHLEDLKLSQTTRMMKRQHPVMSTATPNAIEARRTSASLKQTHHVKIKGPEAIWVSWRGREVSRAFGTAEWLSTTLNMIRHVPEPTEASASSKRTCHVEETGQEAIWVS